MSSNWEWCTLDAISTVVSKGTTPTTLGHNFTTTGIPFLRGEDINGGAVNSALVAFHISEKTHKFLSRSQLPPGDLLITIAGTLGRIGYVPSNSPPLNCNQAVAFVRLKRELVDLNFVCLALQCSDIISALLDLKKVGTIGNLNLEQIRETKIPLPPIAEQKRIAAIAQKCDRLRRTRRYTQQLSDSYLQTVFQEIFKDASFNNYSLGDLALNQRSSFVNGPFGSDLLTSELVAQGVPVIYVRDLRDKRYKRVSTVCVTNQKAKELNFCRVDSGDVLVAKIGDPPGIAAIYPKGYSSAIVTQDVIRIKVNEQLVKPEYLVSFLNSRQGFKALKPIIVKGTRERFGLTQFKEMNLSIPPLPLQEKFAQIVQRFERLRAQQREADRQAEHLFQTILHRAFQGEL